MKLANRLPREDALTLLAEMSLDLELSARPRTRLSGRSLQNALFVQRALDAGDAKGASLALESLRQSVSKAELVFGANAGLSNKMRRRLDDVVALSKGL
ncbi:MAG: hypothetical protein ACI9EF_000053 [Pseudohongiellaceae bacterium]